MEPGREDGVCYKELWCPIGDIQEMRKPRYFLKWIPNYFEILKLKITSFFSPERSQNVSLGLQKSWERNENYFLGNKNLSKKYCVWDWPLIHVMQNLCKSPGSVWFKFISNTTSQENWDTLTYQFSWFFLQGLDSLAQFTLSNSRVSFC